MLRRPGTISCSSSSRFGPTSAVNVVHAGEVAARSGRLATSPAATGSSPVAKTIGMVVVAAFAAITGAGLFAADHSHLAPDQVGY